MNLMSAKLIFTLWLALGIFNHPLSAQTATSNSLQSLTKEMSKLKSDLLLLQRQVYQGGSGSKDSSSNIAADQVGIEANENLNGSIAGKLQLRIQQLEGDVRRLNGELERAIFQNEALAKQMEGLNKDMQFRLERLESNAPVAASGINSPEASTNNANAAQNLSESQPQSTPPNILGTIKQDADGNIIETSIANPAAGTSDQATNPAAKNAILLDTAPASYKLALDKLNNERDYETAEQILKAFLEKWPDDVLAGNARYWLGETYYARKRFDEAVGAFIETYTAHATSPKAPAALLKLALSLDQIDRRKTACEALTTLKQQYPEAEDYLLARAANASQSFSCP